MWPYADCLFFLDEELGIDVTSEPSSSPGQDGRETGATSITNEVIAMFHSASCVFWAVNSLSLYIYIWNANSQS